MHHPPEILLFFGRFHPLLVHLPIGMLTVLAALEVAAFFPRFKKAADSAGFILMFVTPAAIASAVCGWLLSLGGGYPENLLEWHERLGIATAAGCTLAAILFWRGKTTAYRTALFLTVAMMMVAGHLGGSLTHGSDYLTRYAPWRKSSPPSVTAENNPQSLPVFAGVIGPVFHDKCVSCHGPDKSKADLRLDSFAGVELGGEDGKVIQPGDPTQGELFRRILLPLDDDDHMPPSGKPQLTVGEVALLKWWLEAGTPETNIVTELHPPQDILDVLAGRSPSK